MWDTSQIVIDLWYAEHESLQYKHMFKNNRYIEL